LSPRAREVAALALCLASLYALLSLATFREAALDGPIPLTGFTNCGGAIGYYLAFGFVFPLGFAGWVPWLLLLAAGVLLFIGRPLERPTVKLAGVIASAALLAILFAGPDGNAGFALTPRGAGGIFGAFLSPRLTAAVGGPGRLLILGFGLLVALLLLTEVLVSQLLLRALAALEQLWRRWRGTVAGEGVAVAIAGDGVAEAVVDEAAPGPRIHRAARPARAGAARADGAEQRGGQGPEADADAGEDAAAGAGLGEAGAARDREGDGSSGHENAADAAGDADHAAAGQGAAAAATADAAGPTDAAGDAATAPEPTFRIRTQNRPRPKAKKAKQRRGTSQGTLPFDDTYEFPPVELFRETVDNDVGATEDALKRGGKSIVDKLAHFHIQAEVVAVSVGPAVTQYELRLAENIKLNKVTSFEADLAAALRALSVRIVAPIPGKDTIGVEVPNEQRQMVHMRELLEQFGRAEDHAIPLFLGKDVAGDSIVEDLARMPHLLIAGTTGSGKSVCINSILLSILMTRSPAQVKLILVDPKMVELQAFKRVPHLCCEVVTNMKKAPTVLQWAVDEMEHRYQMLSGAGVNHIRSYNRLGQQELEQRMQRPVEPERVQLPYIVIVIDEFADLMNVAQNEVEDLIQRLAQKSRAVGMHVIVATQRPSSEVITGIIKANLPCQIAFRVNRRIDSRVILDANGAEKLLGHGDMLYMPPGGGALLRAQGAFVADDELAAVIRFIEERGHGPQFDRELMQRQTSSRSSPGADDELYSKAVEVVLGQQRGSATLLQRALAVGYTRATRLLELMEADGLVGPFVGSKSRDVLMSLEEWQQREVEMASAMAELEDGEADEIDEDGEEDEDGAEGEDAEDGGADAEDGGADPADAGADPEDGGAGGEDGSPAAVAGRLAAAGDDGTEAGSRP
jgi:S-DNA-T family DNA segregation ATPase FtsK/SpoIIIE